MIKFKFTETDTEYYNNWFSFNPRFERQGFRLTLSKWSYFDPRPKICTSASSLAVLLLIPFLGWWSFLLLPFLFFSWGQIFLSLPYDSKKEQCEYPDYGIMLYSVDGEIPNHMWIRKGWKGRTINFPWAKKFWKREVLMVEGWKKEERGEDLRSGNVLKETHPYTYTLKSGKKQIRTAEIHQEKRYWRSWFGLYTKCRHYLEIEFSDEVGKRSGSWKGGCIGCGYEFKKGESPLQCLQRMSRERKF